MSSGRISDKYFKPYKKPCCDKKEEQIKKEEIIVDVDLCMRDDHLMDVDLCVDDMDLNVDLSSNKNVLDICFKDFVNPNLGMIITNIELQNNNLIFTLSNNTKYVVDLSGVSGGGSGESGSSNIFVVDQDDTTDIDAALEQLKIIIPQDNTILIIRNDKGNIAGYAYADLRWSAFSGNVNASNVLFEDDITCAGSYTQVGNVTKTSTGTTTIPAKGRTIEDVMKTIFTKELQPTATQPSVNLTFSQAGSYEVGKTITPTFSASLNPGSYTYGPATGVAATAWNIKDSLGNTDTNASGSFPSIVITDTTNYTITAEATHTGGAIAITNLGSPSSPTIQITAGTKTKTSSAVTGYRSTFYGVVNDTNPLDSTYIRGLTNDGKASGKKITIKVNGNKNAKRILVALPTASGLKIKSVSKTDGLVTDITSTYSKTGTVMVDGANNVGNLVSYDIWTYQPASIDSAEVHEITIG